MFLARVPRGLVQWPALRYGVEGIPALFLIGPDGKIVATDLRGAEIGKAVSAALGKDGIDN